PYSDRFHFSVQCEIKEFLVVSSPKRLATACNGDLPLPRKRGISCYVNLPAPRLDGFVRHPASILRNRSHIFSETRRERRHWFALANEWYSIELARTSVYEKNPSVLRPVEWTLVGIRLVDQLFLASS